MVSTLRQTNKSSPRQRKRQKRNMTKNITTGYKLPRNCEVRNFGL